MANIKLLLAYYSLDLHDLQGSYSDECSPQNVPSNSSVYVFRAPKDKYKKDLVNLVPHVKSKISCMVFGSIWKKGRSNLVIMQRDPNSARAGYTAVFYLNALEETLLYDYRPGTFFQQDNAPIHHSTAVKDWFTEHGIWVIDWPPYSPDLNPIEHVW